MLDTLDTLTLVSIQQQLLLAQPHTFSTAVLLLHTEALSPAVKLRTVTISPAVGPFTLLLHLFTLVTVPSHTGTDTPCTAVKLFLFTYLAVLSLLTDSYTTTGGLFLHIFFTEPPEIFLAAVSLPTQADCTAVKLFWHPVFNMPPDLFLVAKSLPTRTFSTAVWLFLLVFCLFTPPEPSFFQFSPAYLF